MAIGANHAVRVCDFISAVFGRPNGLGQIFQIHLMADASARWHHTEVFKCALAPAQKLIALTIAVIFKVNILGKAIALAGIIHHDRVIDHQINRDQWIDLFRIRTQGRSGIAHGRQVNDGGNARKVLHQHPCWAKRNFVLGLALIIDPARYSLNIGLGDGDAVFGAQQIFQQDF